MGVGFDWDRSDKRKMYDTYGIGSDDIFVHFIDLKCLAEGMGYYNFGLRSLSNWLLDFDLPHPQYVSLSFCCSQALLQPVWQV